MQCPFQSKHTTFIRTSNEQVTWRPKGRKTGWKAKVLKRVWQQFLLYSASEKTVSSTLGDKKVENNSLTTGGWTTCKPQFVAVKTTALRESIQSYSFCCLIRAPAQFFTIAEKLLICWSRPLAEPASFWCSGKKYIPLLVAKCTLAVLSESYLCLALSRKTNQNHTCGIFSYYQLSNNRKSILRKQKFFLKLSSFKNRKDKKSN